MKVGVVLNGNMFTNIEALNSTTLKITDLEFKF
jgi:hypothetical protein